MVTTLSVQTNRSTALLNEGCWTLCKKRAMKQNVKAESPFTRYLLRITGLPTKALKVNYLQSSEPMMLHRSEDAFRRVIKHTIDYISKNNL